MDSEVLNGEFVDSTSEGSERVKSIKPDKDPRYLWIDGVKCFAKSQKPVGRPQGSKTRSLMNLKGLTPKGYLLRVMEDENASEDKRFRAAIAVAPYCHPKLQAIQQINMDLKADSREDIELRLRENGLDPALVFGETLKAVEND